MHTPYRSFLRMSYVSWRMIWLNLVLCLWYISENLLWNMVRCLHDTWTDTNSSLGNFIKLPFFLVQPPGTYYKTGLHIVCTPSLETEWYECLVLACSWHIILFEFKDITLRRISPNLKFTSKTLYKSAYLASNLWMNIVVYKET